MDQDRHMVRTATPRKQARLDPLPLQYETIAGMQTRQPKRPFGNANRCSSMSSTRLAGPHTRRLLGGPRWPEAVEVKAAHTTVSVVNGRSFAFASGCLGGVQLGVVGKVVVAEPRRDVGDQRGE